MNRVFADGIGGIGVLGGEDAGISQRLNEQLQPLWRI
jgi:hypothetical protein